MTASTASTTLAPDVINEAIINPTTGRPAGSLQGVLLLIGSCLPILGAVLLAPLLPTMSEVFAASPGAAALVPLVLTIPALFIALLSPVAGAIADKFGRKRVLIAALVVYAVVGTAPLYLQSLGAIVLSRVGVGIAEAFIMTCCTTLIADYFTGNRRNRYLGLQALATSLAATVFFAVGGAVGAFGWRTPFWIYAVSIVVAVVMLGAIWPTSQTASGQEQRIVKLPPVPWARLALPTAVAFFGGIAFYTLPVELAYVLAGKGVRDTAALGIATAVASLATAAGAVYFRRAAKRGVAVLLPLALVLAGAGQLIVGVGSTVPFVMAGAIVSGLGTGLLLPTMITWSIARLDHDQRGRGTGLFTGSIFLGEFVTPLIVLALTGATGTLQGAIAIIGIAGVAVCVILAFVLRRFPQQPIAAA